MQKLKISTIISYNRLNKNANPLLQQFQNN